MKKQTDITENQDKRSDNTYRFDEIKKEKPTIKKHNNSNQICCSKYSVQNIIILKNFIVFLFRQNIHFYFTSIFFNSLKPQKRKHKREKSDCV